MCKFCSCCYFSVTRRICFVYLVQSKEVPIVVQTIKGQKFDITVSTDTTVMPSIALFDFNSHFCVRAHLIRMFRSKPSSKGWRLSLIWPLPTPKLASFATYALSLALVLFVSHLCSYSVFAEHAGQRVYHVRGRGQGRGRVSRVLGRVRPRISLLLHHAMAQNALHLPAWYCFVYFVLIIGVNLVLCCHADDEEFFFSEDT